MVGPRSRGDTTLARVAFSHHPVPDEPVGGGVSSGGEEVLVLAQLIPVNGGSPITISRDVTIVGRQKDQCDLVLNLPSISKMHCILVKTDGLLFLRDLSSTNGTKVNGQKVVRGALLPGDQVAFASEKFRVHLGPDNGPREISPTERTEMLLPTDLPAGEDFGAVESDSESDVRLADDLVE